MSKDTARVEWTFLENEQEWQPLSPAPTPTRDGMLPAVHQVEIRLAVLVVVLALLLAGGWGWRRQVQAATLVARLQETVAADVTGAPAPGLLSLPKAQVVDQEFIRGDLVMAQVALHESGEDDLSTYRETRFYRRTAEGWQRVTANSEWLGPVQSLRTTHFTIRYRGVDAVAVAEAAPRLDRLYERLRRDFGLPAIDSSPDIVIYVAMDELLLRHSTIDKTITVLSPAALSVPADITPGGTIYQAAVYPLAALLTTELLQHHQVDPIPHTVFEQSLLYFLPLWAVWDDGGPLSEWQDGVVRWLYQNTQPWPDNPRLMMPSTYAQLCHAYRLLGLSPMDMAIPLACGEPGSLHSTGGYPLFSLRLDNLLYRSIDQTYDSNAPVSTGQFVGMVTVVDYAVVTYGRDTLARWLAALDGHDSWQTLTPAVFGVSVEEFEAGWHAYLQQTYGAPEIRD